jgi:hypothetical protein
MTTKWALTNTIEIGQGVLGASATVRVFPQKQLSVNCLLNRGCHVLCTRYAQRLKKHLSMRLKKHLNTCHIYTRNDSNFIGSHHCQRITVYSLFPSTIFIQLIAFYTLSSCDTYVNPLHNSGKYVYRLS